MILRLLALVAAFVAGWLFSNEVRAPLYADISMGVWLGIGGLGAVLMALGRG